MDNDDFLTVTMAKVYTDQGHHNQAVKIYRKLLKKEPGREDLDELLAKAEQKLVETKNKERLVPLFTEWINLVLKHKRLKQLKKLKSKL